MLDTATRAVTEMDKSLPDEADPRVRIMIIVSRTETSHMLTNF